MQSVTDEDAGAWDLLVGDDEGTKVVTGHLVVLGVRAVALGKLNKDTYIRRMYSSDAR